MMGPGGAIDDYLIDGGGDDAEGELRRALECFCTAPPPPMPPDSGGRSGAVAQDIYGDAYCAQQGSSNKRARDDAAGYKSKACREKMRRDKLNDKFLELSSVLNPGRPPKLDKATILSDAAQILTQLRSEAEQLKEANEKLKETIKDLKAEKIELRDEKLTLKSEKEKLEQQLKAMSLPPAAFLPQPIAFHPAATGAALPFASRGQAPPGGKTNPVATYPGVAMWQWLPPAVVDTTHDPKLWPPNA